MNAKLNYLASLYGYVDFFDYLDSETWHNFCKTNLKESCEKCGSKENLGVQHKNYGSLCLEKPKDVVTLCRICSAKKDPLQTDGWKRWKEMPDHEFYFGIAEEFGFIYAYDSTPTKKSIDAGLAVKVWGGFLWNEEKLKTVLFG